MKLQSTMVHCMQPQRDGYPGVGVFSAMNLESIDLIWRAEPGESGFGTRKAPIVENSIVYVGTTGGPSGSKNGFFALDAQPGDEIWRREGILPIRRCWLEIAFLA